MDCKTDKRVETKTESDAIIEDSEMSAVTDDVSQEPHENKANKNVSRRGLIGGAAAAVILGAGGAIAVPLLNNAATGDSTAPTKDELNKLEYELSLLKNVSDDAELISHKTTTIDSSSTDVQYPSAKAVYNSMTDKVDINQGAEYSGFIFIVGDDGKLKLSKFTSDEWSDSEMLPIENRVIYKQLKDIVKAIDSLDGVPYPNSVKGVESGGVYKTYQETAEVSAFTAMKMGVNYKYSGKGINGSEGNYSVKKIDNVFIAVNQDDPSLVYTSNDGATWGAPYGGW